MGAARSAIPRLTVHWSGCSLGKAVVLWGLAEAAGPALGLTPSSPGQGNGQGTPVRFESQAEVVCFLLAICDGNSFLFNFQEFLFFSTGVW